MSSAAAALPRSASADSVTFRQRASGHTALDHERVFYRLPRLAAGQTQMCCILLVLSETHSASRPKGEKAPEWSCRLAAAKFAWYAGCDLRTAQLQLDDLCQRRVLLRRPSARGEFQYAAPIDTWKDLPDLPDRQPHKKPATSAQTIDATGDDVDSDGAEEGEDTANAQRNKFRDQPACRARIRLTEKPEDLPAGRTAKALPIPFTQCKLQVVSKLPQGHDVRFDAVFHRDFIHLTLLAPEPANAQVTSALSARAAPLKAAVARGEMDPRYTAWRDALNAWNADFRMGLPPPDDGFVRQAVAAAGTVSVEACGRRLKTRVKSGFPGNWGGVLTVIRDEAAAGPPPERRYRAGEHPDEIAARRRTETLENEREMIRTALKWLAHDPKDPHALAVLEFFDPKLIEELRSEVRQ